MFYIIIAFFVVIFLFYEIRFKRKKAIWISANRIASSYKHVYKNSGKLTDNDIAAWASFIEDLPTKTLLKETKQGNIINYGSLAKYLVIRKMFNSGYMKKLSPNYIANNYKLFLKCAFMEKSLVGKELGESGLLSTEDQAVVFCYALDQVDQAVSKHFPKNT